MAEQVRSSNKGDEPVVTERDILFECPSCGKSLLVDVAAEGLIVVCPQCHLNVIVPPKSAPVAPTAPTPHPPVVAPPKSPPPVQPVASTVSPELAALREQLITLGSKMKELQTQRTELTNRIASRLNEVNRDLVMMARLETSQQQLLSDWAKITAQLESGSR